MGKQKGFKRFTWFTDKNSGLAGRYRDLILLAEIGAYLHDIGKLSSFFVLSKAKGKTVRDFHGQILFVDNDSIPSNVREFLFSPLSKILSKGITPNAFPNIAQNISLNTLHGTAANTMTKNNAANSEANNKLNDAAITATENIATTATKGTDLSISLSHFVCAHHGCSRCLSPAECSFKGTIRKHPLIALLKTVDHLDASNPANSGKQSATHTVRDNFFYPETKIDISKLNAARASFYSDFDEFLKKEKSIEKINKFVKRKSEKYFVKALSETRQYGNDITLLDHVKSVSAYFKMYLFNYLVRNRPLPNSFFDANFRIMSVASVSREIEQFISFDIAFSNLILRSDNFSYFLVPCIRENSAFFKYIKHKVRKKFGAWCMLHKMNNFSPLFTDSIHGVPLKDIEEKFYRLDIKRPADIKNDYTEKDAMNDIKKVVFFALLREKEKIFLKAKSIGKHLKNLEKGSIHSKKNLARLDRKENELEKLLKHLNAGTDIETIKKRYGWSSSKDAESEVYDFFSLVLSPIRPPSPIRMSEYFLKKYRRTHSFKKLYERFIIKRPVVLGRILALARVLGEVEETR
ncbi:MAG: hypothetical protein U9Q18_06215 [Caldisericota bacterium]|nr:hypothetical protein [Caldisericota bacterium]